MTFQLCIRTLSLIYERIYLIFINLRQSVRLLIEKREGAAQSMFLPIDPSSISQSSLSRRNLRNEFTTTQIEFQFHSAHTRLPDLNSAHNQERAIDTRPISLRALVHI